MWSKDTVKVQDSDLQPTCSRAVLGWLVTKASAPLASAWQIQGKSCGKVAPDSFLHLLHALQALFFWELSKIFHMCLLWTSRVPNIVFPKGPFTPDYCHVYCSYILTSLWPIAVISIHLDNSVSPLSPRPQQFQLVVIIFALCQVFSCMCSTW